MPKPPSPAKDSIDRAVRALLPRVSRLAAEQGGQPSDFFVVIEKYDPGNVLLLPRSAATDAFAVAKSEARRRRYLRLLAVPCKPSELLVMVAAGDHVEGRRFAVTARLASAVGSTELTKEDFEAYLHFHIPGIVDKILGEGGRLEDHVVILRPPSGAPTTLARADARPHLVEFGERALAMLDVPGESDELLIAFRWNGQPDCARLKVGLERGDEEAARASQMQRLMERWLQVAYDSVVDLGERPSDYCAYVAWPPADGDVVRPEIMPRRIARDSLRGSPKYAQICEHLSETRCDDVLLLVDVQGQPDILVMWRDKEKIPRFRMTRLTSKERER
jgi:hypothetical protein